jgi:putative DNA primase/helicase
MNDFIAFAESFGLVIPHLEEGRWVRVKTEDKPRKRNGSYKYLGDVGFVQNHATMSDPATWHPREHVAPVDRIAYARTMAEKRSADARAERERHAHAAQLARAMIAECTSGSHPYLVRKGFPNASGLVHPNGELIVAMREFSDYTAVNSVQRIGVDGSKLFLSGGKAKGSVFIIGKGAWRERWLVEGFATGLSVFTALSDLRRPAEVIVCFSAGNLRHIADKVRRPAYVMADNDASGTGQEAAESTGLPWIMPPGVGTDANDLHAACGLRALVRLIAGVGALRVIGGTR